MMVKYQFSLISSIAQIAGFLLFVAAIVFSFSSTTPASADDTKTISLESLGESLFLDKNLSRNRTQACATCHMPDHAFTDGRATPGGRAASLGDDGKSLGDRNTPSLAYAHFAPHFGKNAKGVWAGGQFHDGRAATLEEQAGAPPLNPIEMGMPAKSAVVARLKENPYYVRSFAKIFGRKAFDDDSAAYLAMTNAIAAFVKMGDLSPFDSRYDRSLRGEIKLTDEEELGRILFFSKQFTNCNQCHQLKPIAGGVDETFTNYEFHNIGVPENVGLRTINGMPRGRKDLGLFANVAAGNDEAHRGKFKTPSLRNVAVTGPYMHNGIFADLRTVILFYNKYNSKASGRQINPETGIEWASPEVPENISLKELESGPALKDREVDALLAFLKSLTDKRYEFLMQH